MNLDGTLLYEDRNGTDLYYYYDSYGTITAISAYLPNGASGYVFVGTNSLGDVNALYNANGDLIVRYEYDAWGKVLAETDANGNALTGTAATWSQLNPFRYRGYVYDAETGLYYLQSRYYDAEVGRFLNSDAIVNTADSLGCNTFAYCGNNPVNCVDPTGYDASFVNSFSSKMKDAWIKGYDYVCQAESYGAYKKFAEHLTRPRENGSTFSFGFTGGYTSGGVTGGKSYALSVDSSYNYALQKTESVGVATGIGASGGIAISFTDATNVNDLNGKSLSRGVTLISIFGISIDYIEFNPASNPDKTCRGINVVISAGGELDFHAMENYTTTIKQWNPFKHFQ